MKQRKYVLAFCIFLILLVGAGYKFYLQQQAGRVMTGTVEATKADVTPRIGGYLTELKVKEGDWVQKNIYIAQIDKRDLEAQLMRDQSALAKSQAQLDNLEKGARPQELREAAANVAAALSVYEKSHTDLLRYEKLYKDGAISRQQYDNAISVDMVASNQLAATKAKENLLLEGYRIDEILAQKEDVKRMKAVLESTQIALRDMTLKSPLEGIVLTKNYEVGEFVNAGAAIVTLANLKDCWVKVYVPSDMLGVISVGQEAEVKIDAYPERKFIGKIKEINDSAEYTPRQSITKNERANLVFAVKVALPNEEGIFKPGMIADVILQ